MLTGGMAVLVGVGDGTVCTLGGDVCVAGLVPVAVGVFGGGVVPVAVGVFGGGVVPVAVGVFGGGVVAVSVGGVVAVSVGGMVAVSVGVLVGVSQTSSPSYVVGHSVACVCGAASTTVA